MRVVGGRDASVARLLPWTGAGGKPCYVVGDGTGYVSRRADEVEDIQLDMADELLGHAADLLTEPSVTAPEIHAYSPQEIRRFEDFIGHLSSTMDVLLDSEYRDGGPATRTA